MILRKAGLSEEFIQRLIEYLDVPDDSETPPMNNYNESFFSYFSYSNQRCVSFLYSNRFHCDSTPCQSSPNMSWGSFSKSRDNTRANKANYFYNSGHAYLRHNGHFHNDDDHRFENVANLSKLPESAFAGSYYGAATKRDRNYSERGGFSSIVRDAGSNNMLTRSSRITRKGADIGFSNGSRSSARAVRSRPRNISRTSGNSKSQKARGSIQGQRQTSHTHRRGVSSSSRKNK